MQHKSSYDPLRGFLLDGTAAHVNAGCLQTPGEFAKDCLAMRQRPQYDSWAIATQLPDETVRVLQSPLVPKASRVVMLESEQGIVYPIVILQSAALQVRLLLSLANRDTREWLRAVASDGNIHISVEIPEKNQVAVVTVPCRLRDGASLEEAIRSCALPDRDSFVSNAAKAARQLAELDTMPSLIPEYRLREVRLVLVLETGPGYSASTSEAKARALH